MQKSRAFELLGLPPDSGVFAIDDAYRRRRNRFESKLASCSSSDERARYEKALRVLEAARAKASSGQAPASPTVRPNLASPAVPTPAPQARPALRESMVADLPGAAPHFTKLPPIPSDDADPPPRVKPIGKARRTGFGGSSLRASQMADLPGANPGRTAAPFAGLGGAGSGTPATAGVRPNEVIAGRYEVRGLLGEGGMGQVYRVFDRSLGKDIAMKVLHPALVNNEQARERFQREARISLELGHPNIVKVHDVHRDEHQHFITMELLEGHTLRDEMEIHLAQGKSAFPIDKAIKIAKAICSALEFAHEFTIHRDIKPENIFLCQDGTVKLMDFGIAGMLVPSQLTMTGAAMGTAYYMPPEQLAGDRSIDHRADQYSLAVVLYEMLAGGVPQGRVAPLKALRRSVGAPISSAVDRALSPQAKGRFKSMSAFASELRLKPAWYELKLVRVALFLLLVIALIGLAWNRWQGQIEETWNRWTIDDAAVTAAQKASDSLDVDMAKLRGIEAFVDVRQQREVEFLRTSATQKLNDSHPAEAVEDFEKARSLLRQLMTSAKERERDFAKLTEKQTSISIFRDELDQVTEAVENNLKTLRKWLGRDRPQDPEGFAQINKAVAELKATRQYLDKKLSNEEDQIIAARESVDQEKVRIAHENLSQLEERLVALREGAAYEKLNNSIADLDRRLKAMLKVEETLALGRIAERKRRAELARITRKQAMTEYSQSIRALAGRPPLEPRLVVASRGTNVKDVEKSHVERLAWQVQMEVSGLVEQYQLTPEANTVAELAKKSDDAFNDEDYVTAAELSDEARLTAFQEQNRVYSTAFMKASKSVNRRLNRQQQAALDAARQKTTSFTAAESAARGVMNALADWRRQITQDEISRQESLRCKDCKGNQDCRHCDRRGEIEIDCSACDGGNITRNCSDCRAKGEIDCTRCSRGRITESCRSCNGRGQVDCSSCNNGRNTCNYCRGQGRTTCAGCSGRGTLVKVGDIVLPCFSCAGTGQSNCGGCRGGGQTSCGACYGQGNVDCDSCSGDGKVTASCPACNGQGENRCRSCSGKGRIVDRCLNCRNGLLTVSCRHCGGDRVCKSCDGKGRQEN